MDKYDIIILGAGIAGYSAAIKGAILGKKVCLIEKEKLGGTCLHQGCIPTKAILETTKFFSLIRKSAEYGIEISSASKFNLASIIERKNQIVDRLASGINYLLNKRKITIFSGLGEIMNSSQVKITSLKQQPTTVEGKHIIIATGSLPRQVSSVPINEDKIISSNQALSLTTFPKTVLIVGGGVIGCEWATIFNELGAKVTIVEILPSILPMVDEEILKIYLRTLKKKKITVITSLEHINIEQHGVSLITSLKTKEKDITVESEIILSAIGRIPNLEGINAGTLGLQIKNHQIVTNQYLQTNLNNIYAVGDVIGNPMLAHVALREAMIALDNLAGQQNAIDYSVVPNCIYTHPEISSIGLTEQEAHLQGYNLTVGTFNLKASGRAQTMGDTEGLVKIIGNKENDQILGAHLIGPSASELISFLGLARQEKIPLTKLKNYMYPHPTLSESLGEAALSIYGEGIHHL